MCYEKDIPAEQQAQKEKTRVPSSDANSQRSQDSQFATEKRTQDPVGVVDQGLPQGCRLRKRADFQRIYRNGIRVVGRFVVVFAENGPGAENRLGITASRKIGSAVVRNRCKRRIREVFRLNRSWLPHGNIGVVMNARRGCAEVSWHEFRRDYAQCLKRLNQILAEKNNRGTTGTKR